MERAIRMSEGILAGRPFEAQRILLSFLQPAFRQEPATSAARHHGSRQITSQKAEAEYDRDDPL